MPESAQRARIESDLAAILADAPTSHCKNAARIRVRREYGDESGEYALALACRLTDHDDTRWLGWCVARYHKNAFALLDGAMVEALAAGGFCDAATPDEFARILAGPAWVAGAVEDARVLGWAKSQYAAWRQVAATSTVALNTKGDGGAGDADRTQMVLDLLAEEEDAGVRKAAARARRSLEKLRNA